MAALVQAPPTITAGLTTRLAYEFAREAALPATPDRPARLKASDAMSCARRIAFGSLGVPRDIPPDPGQQKRFHDGDVVDSASKAELACTLDARVDVAFDLRPDGHDLWGKADACYDDVVVEVKSKAARSFHYLVAGRNPGPEADNLVQAGFAAVAPQIDAARVHMVYVGKPDRAGDEVEVAEWVIPLDQPLTHLADGGDAPTVQVLVDDELRRLARVLGVIDDGDLPPRHIPGWGRDGMVRHTPPDRDSEGGPWQCRFCPWQPTCAGLAPEIVPGWVDAHIGAAA